MSPQEARKRAEIIPSHIESSKAMNFDVRVQTKQGQFDYAAREVLSALPRSNPLKKNHPVFCADCNRVARKANEELAGVVEVGLFCDMCDVVILAGDGGVETIIKEGGRLG